MANTGRCQNCKRPHSCSDKFNNWLTSGTQHYKCKICIKRESEIEQQTQRENNSAAEHKRQINLEEVKKEVFELKIKETKAKEEHMAAEHERQMQREKVQETQRVAADKREKEVLELKIKESNAKEEQEKAEHRRQMQLRKEKQAEAERDREFQRDQTKYELEMERIRTTAIVAQQQAITSGNTLETVKEKNKSVLMLREVMDMFSDASVEERRSVFRSIIRMTSTASNGQPIMCTEENETNMPFVQRHDVDLDMVLTC